MRQRSGMIVKRAALVNELGVVARACDSPRVQRNDAAQPAPVLRRNPGSHHVDRFEFVILKRRREGDRPVVIDRHPIDHVLRVVFRPARMQHGVCLQQPTRHRRHRINGAAAERRTEGHVKLLPLHLNDARGLRRVQQRRRTGHRNFRGQHAQLKPHVDLLGNRRPDLHLLAELAEAILFDGEQVHARSQPLHPRLPFLIRLLRHVDHRIPGADLHAGRDRPSRRVGHQHADLSFENLAEGRRRAQGDQQGKRRETHCTYIPRDSDMFTKKKP